MSVLRSSSNTDEYEVGTPGSASITVTDNDDVPGKPATLTTLGKHERVDLTWIPPADTGTSAIDSYEYRSKETAATNWSGWDSVGGDGNTRTYTVTNLTNGTDYSFQVRAVSAAGDGAASDTATATPVPPPYITNIEITSEPKVHDTYSLADGIITVAVTFSEAVDTRFGPLLDIKIGNTTFAAEYTSGDLTDTLVFRLNIHVSREDADGISIPENALRNTSISSITAVSNDEPAVLSHDELGDDPEHKLETIRPTYESGEVVPDGTKLALTFSEEISEVDDTKITVQVDGTTVTVTDTSINGAQVELTLQAPITSDMAVVTVELDRRAFFDRFKNANTPVSAQTLENNYALAEWELTIDSGGNTDENGNPVVIEGGDSVTATARITNGVTFATDQNLDLKWGTLDVGGGAHVNGANNAGTITVPANQSQASLMLHAPQAAGVQTYRWPRTFDLIASLGNTEADKTPLTWRDDENPPVATISAENAKITEGEDIRLTASPVPGFRFKRQRYPDRHGQRQHADHHPRRVRARGRRHVEGTHHRHQRQLHPGHPPGDLRIVAQRRLPLHPGRAVLSDGHRAGQRHPPLAPACPQRAGRRPGGHPDLGISRVGRRRATHRRLRSSLERNGRRVIQRLATRGFGPDIHRPEPHQRDGVHL